MAWVVVLLLAALCGQATADPGCTDSAATNYDPTATSESGGCEYDCATLQQKLEPVGGQSFSAATCHIYSTQHSWPWDAHTSVPVSGTWIVQGMAGAAKNNLTVLPNRFDVPEGAVLAVRHLEFVPDLPVEPGIPHGGVVAVTAGALRLTKVRATQLVRISAGTGGAVYGAQGSTIELVDSKFTTQAGTAGCVHVVGGTSLNISGSTFDKCKSLSQAGGAVRAEGSNVLCTNSTMSDGEDNAVPGQPRGVAMFLQDATRVRVIDTVISPFDVQTSATLEPIGQLMDFVDSCDGAESPCPAGTECSFSKFSIWCAGCHDGEFSTDGRVCQQCPAGTQPKPDKSSCETCPDGTWSPGGSVCLTCGEGLQPTLNKKECMGGYRCPAGKQCPKSACYSEPECTRCPPHQYASGGGNNCTVCPHGADSPFHVDGEVRSKCEPCLAGTGPNDDHTGCIECGEGNASTYGVCQACQRGSIPKQDHSGCLAPYQCPPGTFCDATLHPTGCGASQPCSNCSLMDADPQGQPGKFQSWNNDGQTCQPCTTVGWAVNHAHTSCSQCDPGKEPSPDHSTCVDCTGTTYSNAQNGVVKCTKCDLPSVPTNGEQHAGFGHKYCSLCPDGKGPRADQRGCESCSGNTQSVGGDCKACPSGKVARDDHTFCDICPEHQGFSTNQTGVCRCADEGGKRSEGYYNASDMVIVCLTDSFNQVDVDNAWQDWEEAAHISSEAATNPCRECPPCADCRGDPKIKAGYIVVSNAELDREIGKSKWGSSARKHFVFAFLCDEPTSVNSSFEEDFGYKTTKLANARCPSRSLKNVSSAMSSSGKGRCGEGYEGYFCEICQKNYHKSHGEGECEQCDNGDVLQEWRIIVLVCVVALIFVIYAGYVWSERKKVATAASNRQMRGDNDANEQGEEENDQSASCCSAARQSLWMLYRVGKAPTRTVVTYMQVSSQLSTVLDTKYPQRFADVLNYFKPFRDIFGVFFSAECAGLPGFQNRWWLRIVALPVLMFVIMNLEFGMAWLTAVMTGRGRQWNPTLGVDTPQQTTALTGETLRDKAYGRYISRGLLFIFLTYPTVCNTAFSALNCRHLSDYVQVLVADDTIVCSDIMGVTGVATTQASSFHMYQVFSIVVIVVFGVGVPLGFLVYICCATRDVDESVWEDRAEGRANAEADHAGGPSRAGSNSSLNDQQTDGISQRMAIDLGITEDRARGTYQELSTLSNMSNLTEAYNPKYPWWETMDMLRKLSLVGFVVLVGRGSVAQIAFGNMLSFGFFAAHMYFFPMKTKWDNWLRAAAEIHVFWTITIAFVVRNDLSHEVLGNDEWGDILVISLIVCVPASYIVCLIGKWREINGDLLEAQLKDEAMDQSVNSTENERLVTKARVAYCAYKHGLSTAADRQLLKSYCMELKKPARERSTRSILHILQADSTADEEATAATAARAGQQQPPPPRRRDMAPSGGQSRPVSPERGGALKQQLLARGTESDGQI